MALNAGRTQIFFSQKNKRNTHSKKRKKMKNFKNQLCLKHKLKFYLTVKVKFIDFFLTQAQRIKVRYSSSKDEH